MGKAWWKSKTVWFNVLSLIAAVLLGVAEAPVIGPDTAAIIIGVVNGINLFLRSVTSEPIKASEDG